MFYARVAVLALAACGRLGFGEQHGDVDAVDALASIAPPRTCTPFTAAAGVAAIEAAVVADLDGDPYPDIAATGYQDAITWSGTASDGLVMKSDTALFDNVHGLTTADMTGAGHRDIVVADEDAYIDIVVNNGDGTFMAPQQPDSGQAAYALAVGDLDHDGILDVVDAGTNGLVAVMRGLGAGDLGVPTTYPLGAVSPGTLSSVAVADVDGDGKLDVVTLAATGLRVLLGNGDLTLQPHLDVTVGTQMAALALGDLDRDGRVDAVVADVMGNAVYYLHNNGGGSFGPPVSIATGSQPIDVAIADFNGDHALDIAIAFASAGGLEVLDGAGDGTFAAPRGILSAYTPHAISAGDFDADGVADVVVTVTSPPTLVIVISHCQ